MKFNTLLYSIRQGFRNIFHNKMFSIASLATMSICIFMFGLFYILVSNVDTMVRNAEDGVAITVFFEEGITTEELQALADEIAARPEVADMKYVSAEEAWESFQKVYFEGQEELAAGFTDDNPLANSANFEIYLKDIAQQDSLVEYLESLDGIRSVKQSEQLANTLVDFNRLLGYLSVAIIAILLAIAVFLISNTVTVGISVRKDEIAIMKLIGATDFLVRAPFIVEGVVIGFVGAAIPLVLLYFIYEKTCYYISVKFSFLGAVLSFIDAASLFRILVPVALILGIGIGLFGSALTLHKHMNV